MPRIVFFIACMGLFFGILRPERVYAADSAYDIKGVQVDILDESAVKARNKAFIEGQKKAFLLLAARFEAPEALAKRTVPADNVLSGLIQDFEISSEQLSTKRYRGVYDFRFRPSAVNQFFGHGPTYFDGGSASQGATALILPYYQEGANAPVFDKKRNPYWVSLNAELPKDGSVILPAGDISDANDIGEGDPHVLSSGTIRRLMARYDVEKVYVALVHVDLKQPQSVKVDIFRTDNGRIELSNTIAVAPKAAAAATFEQLKSSPHIVQDNAPIPLEDETPPAPREPSVPVAETPPPATESEVNPGPFMPPGQRAMPDKVRQRMAEIESRRSASGAMPQQPVAPTPSYQQQTQSMGAQGAVGQAPVQIFFTNMSEWMAIQRQLSGVTGVTSIRIVSLKTNQVDVVVAYKDWNSFVSSLEKMGMSLEPQPDKSYILKRQAGRF